MIPFIDRTIHDCTRCPLHAEGLGPIPGTASKSSVAVGVIGDHPNTDEKTPFTDSSGLWVRGVLGQVGLKGSHLGFVNVISCHDKSKKGISGYAIDSCWDNHDLQTSYLSPKIWLVMGKVALDRTLPGLVLTRVRGNLLQTNDGDFVLPTWSARYARGRGNETKFQVNEDVKKLSSFLSSTVTERWMLTGEWCYTCGGEVEKFNKNLVPFCSKHFVELSGIHARQPGFNV